MEKSVDDCLEVEEIGVATEAVDPSDPHEEGVLDWVEQSENYHNMAFYIAKGQAIVKAEGEKLKVGVEQGRIVHQNGVQLKIC